IPVPQADLECLRVAADVEEARAGQLLDGRRVAEREQHAHDDDERGQDDAGTEAELAPRESEIDEDEKDRCRQADERTAGLREEEERREPQYDEGEAR